MRTCNFLEILDASRVSCEVHGKRAMALELQSRQDMLLDETETESLTEILPGVGEVVDGRYLLEAEVSEGGMGTVYRAYDFLSEEIVAIKIALPHVPDAPQRMMREADLLADVASKGVPALRDFGRVRSSAYFVMDLAEGEDLEAELGRHRCLTPKRAVLVVTAAARILQRVHETKVIHRDVKPANIIVGDSTDEVSLIDFGIARRFMEVEAPEADVTGSPRYMSPEQIAGKPIDHRTDIWSIGVTLYELLVGTPPFNRPTLTGIMTAMLTERLVPPSEIVPNVPKELDEIILRCLAMDPDHRYDDMNALIEDLERLPTLPNEARPSGVLPVRAGLATATTELELEQAEGTYVLPLVRKRPFLRAA